ncbi:hypothetical protein [Paenibacillus polymyxa]|nr:hypothetical protein [Paenibacillus polymyxa]WCM61899.1 hypothetical protein OYT09_02690 [Paenibacillus polymyxa]
MDIVFTARHQLVELKVATITSCGDYSTKQRVILHSKKEFTTEFKSN